MQPGSMKRRLNFAPCRIEAFFENQSLGLATAFHYFHKDATYLITNWHNVTGRDPASGKCLHTQAGVPDRLRVGLPVVAEANVNLPRGQATKYGWKEAGLRLYQDEARLKPFWFEHPIHREKVDAIAIRVTVGFKDKVESVVVNDPALVQTNIEMYPGMDVFVLGYPLGLTGGGRFPIWKRGSFATEPGIDLHDLPKIYIDTATKKGMSGAPVFASASSVWWPENSERNKENMQLGSALQFVGVYSGHIGNDPMEAQLGVVWKERALVEIIEGEILGQSQF
jgi:hypothetical protein